MSWSLLLSTRRALALLACAIACGGPQTDTLPTRDLAQDLVLGPDWIELTASPPLLVQRPVAELVLHHAPDLTLTRAFGRAKNAIYMPRSGEMMLLDIELVDNRGSVEALESAGISPGRLGMKPLEGDLPERFEATKVRLRSNRPLAVSRLEWRARTQ